MAKKTAIEWLMEELKGYDQLEIHHGASKEPTYTIVVPPWVIKEKVEQAKKMEEDQIREAWFNGLLSLREGTITYEDSQKYYQETFKK